MIPSHIKKSSQWILSIFFITILSACGSSDSGTDTDSGISTQTLTGTAAKGAAIDGLVYVKDVAGTEVNIATGANGSFTVDVTGMYIPFMIRILPSDGSPTLYSFANTYEQVANITPLTNLAMFIAAGSSDLSTIYASWNGKNISRQSIKDAQAVINANLQAKMMSAGLDYTTYDFMADAFSADGTGIDGILDDLVITVNHAAGIFSLESISAGDLPFDSLINTSGITINGDYILGPNETPAKIPPTIANDYYLTFSQTAAGSGIGNSEERRFIVTSDGFLHVQDINFNYLGILSNPVFYRGNTSDAIWFDRNNNIKYTLSSLVNGFNEINVSSIAHYDQPGYSFYGQFTGNYTTYVCSEIYGKLTISANDADKQFVGDPFCPTERFLSNGSSLQLYDLGFFDTAHSYSHPTTTLNISVDNGIESDAPGYVYIGYEGETGSTSHWHLLVQSSTLAALGVTVDINNKTMTFNTTLNPTDPGIATGPLTLTGTISYQ